MIKKLLVLLSLFSFLFIGMGVSFNKKINIHTFEELPETERSLDNNIANPLKEELTKGIGKAFLKRKHKTEYILTIQYDDKEYIKVVTLPEEQETIGTLKEMIGYYFTKKDKEKVVNRYLVYLTEKSIKSHSQFQELYDEDDLKNFHVATYWNLTTNQYSIRKKAQVWGLIKKQHDGYHLHVSLPFNTDDLISITLDYRYFNNYIFGIQGAWQNAHYTVLREDKYSGIGKAFYDDFNLLFNELHLQISTKIANAIVGESVNKIQSYVITKEQKRDYIEAYNKQRADEIAYCKSIGKTCQIEEATYDKVFNSENKMYSVFMQSIDRWFQKGATFHEVTIVDLSYEYNGKIYQLDNEDIISNTPGYLEPETDLDNIGKWFKNLLIKVGKFIQKNWKSLLIAVVIIAVLALTVYFWPVIGPIVKGIGNVFKKIFGRNKRRRR